MKIVNRKLLLAGLIGLTGCNPGTPEGNTSEDDRYPVYTGSDLGMNYSADRTAFRMWSPDADSVKLHLYSMGHGDNRTGTFAMERDTKGTWVYALEGDQKGNYYTYQILYQGNWLDEKPDLYAVATGVNGHRSMILDLDATDPEGWENDQRPALANPTDIVLYEVHIRDFTIAPSSGVKNKGKYLGMVEEGTRNSAGAATGLDHLKHMGVTHVHLLPAFDHRSIDESRLDSAQFNWGYDPLNYNVPEGSFATDPYDGSVRVREFKQMVKGLHDNGIRVIMDVVYNHTGQTMESNFNQLVPDYFYRFREDGTFSDASACGNETASEKEMMRKFMIESVKYWAEEYHVDGFRFDLMGIHDIETMNEIAASLHEMDSTIFIYGEGWTAGTSPLPDTAQAVKKNTYLMPGVAAFSDDIRDGLKGSVFDHEDRGFASGKKQMKESVKFGVVASTQHPGVQYDSVNYSRAAWAAEPRQTINYVSCHDNHTLYDKLKISVPDATPDEIASMHRLANTIVLTSQGVPFLHAGVEFMRTKEGVENSYNSPDSINQLNWQRKTDHELHVAYYQALISIRRKHPVFRLTSADQIREQLTFHDTDDDLLVVYEVDGSNLEDNWQKVLVAANGSETPTSFQLPGDGEWIVASDGKIIDENGLRKADAGAMLSVPAYSAMILFKSE